MKRTLSGIFRNYCATAFTPLAILSVAPSTQAKTVVETDSVPALGQAAALRPQKLTEARPQISKISRSFSFSSIQADFLSTSQTASAQTRPSVPEKASSDSLSFQSTLPVGRPNQALLAQNASDTAPPSSTPDIPDYLQNEKPNRFFIGPEVFYRNYNEEEITPGFKSFESGFLYGVKVQYDYVKRNSVYIGTDLRYDRGQTNYSSQNIDETTGVTTPISSKTNNEFFNFEGRLGYTFKADKVGRLLLTPFVGYGYQQWNRDITGPGGYTEDYSWQYFAGGLRAEYRPSRRFTIGMNLKLMRMINGSMDVQNYPGAVAVKALDLGERLQAEVELPITYHLVDTPKSGIALRFAPFYRSQNIGRGDSVGFIAQDENGQTVDVGSNREPASTTDVYGATFGVVFSF